MVDKRKFNAITQNFKPMFCKVEDGRLMVCFGRADDGEGGMEFIASDGYGKTRNKNSFPDKAYYRIDLPKGWSLLNRDAFKPTKTMYEFAEAFFENDGDEKLAVKAAKMAMTTLKSWKKVEGFKDWLNAQVDDACKTHYAKSVAKMKNSDNPQLIKAYVERFGSKIEEDDKPNITIVDFAGDYYAMKEKYGIK